MYTLPTSNPQPNRISSTKHTYKTTEAVFEKQGYTQVYKNRSKDKQEFFVEYDLINTTDKNTLVNFFKARFGKYERFYFYNHIDGVTYTVRFKDDELQIEHLNTKFCNIKFYLKEVN